MSEPAAIIVGALGASGSFEVTCIDCDGVVAVITPSDLISGTPCSCGRGDALFDALLAALGPALCGAGLGGPAAAVGTCELPAGHAGAMHTGCGPDGVWRLWPREDG